MQKLEGLDVVLSSLKGRYWFVVATKGDLLDQERKLKKCSYMALDQGWGVQELVADGSIGYFLQPQNSQVESCEAVQLFAFAPEVIAIPRAGH